MLDWFSDLIWLKEYIFSRQIKELGARALEMELDFPD